MKFNINIKNVCTNGAKKRQKLERGNEESCIHHPSLIFKHCFTVPTPVFFKACMIMVIYKWCNAADQISSNTGDLHVCLVCSFACGILLKGRIGGKYWAHTSSQFICLLTHTIQSAFSFLSWPRPSSKNLVPTTSLYIYPSPQCESVSLGLYPLAGGKNEVLGSESVLLGAFLWREAPVKRRKAPLQMRENQ